MVFQYINEVTDKACLLSVAFGAAWGPATCAAGLDAWIRGQFYLEPRHDLCLDRNRSYGRVVGGPKKTEVNQVSGIDRLLIGPPLWIIHKA